METIELYDTFDSIVGLFVAKGIKETAERDKIPFEREVLEYQLIVNIYY
ncbi:hypothetical protein [Alkalihalobacterium alkalinitrilicum]|nr:hypothetical protein [Alkalihalobacterium alkalinitrilicum]